MHKFTNVRSKTAFYHHSNDTRCVASCQNFLQLQPYSLARNAAQTRSVFSDGHQRFWFVNIRLFWYSPIKSSNPTKQIQHFALTRVRWQRNTAQLILSRYNVWFWLQYCFSSLWVTVTQTTPEITQNPQIIFFDSVCSATNEANFLFGQVSAPVEVVVDGPIKPCEHLQTNFSLPVGHFVHHRPIGAGRGAQNNKARNWFEHCETKHICFCKWWNITCWTTEHFTWPALSRIQNNKHFLPFCTKEHGIDRQVSSQCIELPVLCELHFCMPAVRPNIDSQSRHFKIFLEKGLNFRKTFQNKTQLTWTLIEGNQRCFKFASQAWREPPVGVRFLSKNAQSWQKSTMEALNLLYHWFCTLLFRGFRLCCWSCECLLCDTFQSFPSELLLWRSQCRAALFQAWDLSQLRLRFSTRSCSFWTDPPENSALEWRFPWTRQSQSAWRPAVDWEVLQIYDARIERYVRNECSETDGKRMHCRCAMFYLWVDCGNGGVELQAQPNSVSIQRFACSGAADPTEHKISTCLLQTKGEDLTFWKLIFYCWLFVEWLEFDSP